MIILSLDLSFAKTGWAISKVDLSNNNIELIDCGLLVSPTSLEAIERMDHTITDIISIKKKYKPDLIIKESAIMGRSSTGLNVIKMHGAFEYKCFVDLIPLDEIHNQTIKAWARRYLINKEIYTKETIKDVDKKLIVALAIQEYYNRDIKEIYTARGRLLDDIADAIAITISYIEKHYSYK